MATLGMTPAGYAALETAYGLDALPNWHRSYISATGTHKKNITPEGVEETYTSRYRPGESLGEQLEFALKYDGINLGILTLHRLLIHNLLSRLGFTPEGIMFPVSAAMLKHPREYDASLEAFSRPLMKLVDYSLDNTGRMSVSNDTARFYRYIDFTPQAEALYSFIERTIETELVSELSFLEHYDTAKISIQEIVDMPDRLIDLAIRLCIQNNGRISQAKRASQFESLSDEEMEKIEAVVRKAFQIAD